MVQFLIFSGPKGSVRFRDINGPHGDTILRILSFLLVYVLVSLLVPVAIAALCYLFRSCGHAFRPTRSCRWCGGCVESDATRSFCSNSCEEDFLALRNQIVMEHSGQRAHHAV